MAGGPGFWEGWHCPQVEESRGTCLLPCGGSSGRACIPEGFSARFQRATWAGIKGTQAGAAIESGAEEAGGGLAERGVPGPGAARALPRACRCC